MLYWIFDPKQSRTQRGLNDERSIEKFASQISFDSRKHRRRELEDSEKGRMDGKKPFEVIGWCYAGSRIDKQCANNMMYPNLALQYTQSGGSV